MIKKLVFVVACGALTLCSGLALAGPLAVNFDAALGDPTPAGANLNLFTTDGNGNGNGDPNGILDSDELAVLSWILADASRPHHDAAHTAYAANLAQLDADMTSNPLAAAYKSQLLIALTGYITLGDAGGFARGAAIVAQAGLILNAANYNQTQAGVLAFDGDADGDGQTNLQEYTAIAGAGGPGSAKRAQYLVDVITAPITPVVVDFDAAMTTAGLNPASTDGNGGAAGTPNGILDSDELAVLAFILADTANTHFGATKTAYEKNLAQMNADLGGFAASYGVPLAGYMTLGDSNTVARVTAILGSVGKTLTTAGYDLSQSVVLAYNADPDNDAITNGVEYQDISGTGGPGSQKRTNYIAAVFTPYVNPECITCNPSGSIAEVGGNVCLRVPVVSGNSFQWYFNGTPLTDGRVLGSQCQYLRISNAQLQDSGVYKCSYNDGTKAVQNYVIKLTVGTALPASSTLALVLLMAVMASAGAVTIMRVKRSA
jgi:hypothetical protein